jgi:uncharacterized protein DUF6791/ThiF family protein
MSHRLISRNADLRRFWDEGYEIELVDGHLLINQVPYVDSSAKIKYGTLVSTLHLAGDATLKPDTHVAYFIGDAPCDKNGSVISAILNSSSLMQLTANLRINHTFSSKPANGYADYFEKMTTYVNIISGPAKSLDDSVTEKTFRIIEPNEAESVFNYLDTNSVRARIQPISQKLSDQRIAIIGTGGTGSYILDLVAKTMAKEIHLYDGDILKSHNAFRGPGAPSIEELRQRVKKVDYLSKIYSKLHRRITPHAYYIDASNMHELSAFDFVFLSLDVGKVRKQLVDFLLEKDISFVDSGIGLQNIDNELIGIVRVTTCTKNKNDHATKTIPFESDVENEYANNIQIADLNAFNATLAVIKWKKLCGFYNDLERENHSTYTINVNMLTSTDHEA